MGPFYFAGMPFVFAGQGVHVTSLGQDTFGGQTYDHYKASFTVGNSPKDEDPVWVVPATVRQHTHNPSACRPKPLSHETARASPTTCTKKRTTEVSRSSAHCWLCMGG